MTKAELRRELRALRNSVDPTTARASAAAIAEHLRPHLESARCVAAFAATQNEVDLRSLYGELLARGATVCFPRVIGEGVMVFVPVATLDELQPGAFGILEPPEGPPVDAPIDVVLVPGLGFDHRGNRLGFGGGYYDRALGSLRDARETVPLFVGIGYSCQVLEMTLPLDAWDVLLDLVITEQGSLTLVSSR